MKGIIGASALVLFSCLPTYATYVAPVGSDGKGTGLQTKLNKLVTAGVGDTWSAGTLANGDYVGGTIQNGQSALDVLWALSGPGASSTTIVLEIAGNASVNTFGFYDPADPSKRAQIFAGSATGGSKLYIRFNGNQLQYSANNLNFSDVPNGNFSSQQFGVYMGSKVGVLYSNPALNSGNDNLVAYQGFGSGSTGRKLKVGSVVNSWDANSYVLAWEDLSLPSSDKDYQDMVLLMSGVVPVPEPSTYVIGSLLLLPILLQLRRRTKL